MISEPEMTGGEGHGSDPPETQDPPRRGGGWRHVPPWGWALIGAFTASAVWAAGLYAFEDSGPPRNGYKATKDLCEDAELAELTRGSKRSDESSASSHDPALDEASCSLELDGPRRKKSEPGRRGDYRVYITYELHKKTDPKPEFKARTKGIYWGQAEDNELEALPGLGNQAFLVIQPEQDSLTVAVVDGGAELRLRIGLSATETRVDDDALRRRLIADMKSLMARLKS